MELVFARSVFAPFSLTAKINLGVHVQLVWFYPNEWEVLLLFDRFHLTLWAIEYPFDMFL